MPEFDFDAARRWARFDPKKTLARRGDDELPFASCAVFKGTGKTAGCVRSRTVRCSCRRKSSAWQY
jgi:hypothetical protein